MIELLIIPVILIIVLLLHSIPKHRTSIYNPKLLNRTEIQGIYFNDDILSKYLSHHFYKKHEDNGQTWYNKPS